MKIIFKLLVLIVPFHMMTCSPNPNIVIYPAIPNLIESDLYRIEVNGHSIWTEKFQTNFDLQELPEWFTGSSYVNQQQEVHMANLSCEGDLRVRIELNEPITRASVRPFSRGIKPDIQGQILEFSLSGPDKLYININDLSPLLFFANPLESDVPDPENPNVHFFEPGVHRPGMMHLTDSATVYIAGGAIVYGGIRTDGASHIRILGRGILDGNFEFRRMVVPENSRNVKFDGIIIRNGVSWTNTIVNCSDVRYEDVKVISFGPGGDGINPLGSQNVTINNCFFRCTDDCIAIKSPDPSHVVKNIRVTNNTMIGFAYSDGVTIGFETNGRTVSDVLVKNCDILQARGGSRVDGHSAFSIICDGPATISDVRYEDIRVEEDILKLFELHITDGTKYGINPPGHIKDIHLKNIRWASERPIILRGFDDEHLVQNVTFEDCWVNDLPLKDKRDELLQMGDFVQDVTIK